MKLIAKFKDVLNDNKNNAILSLIVENYIHKTLIKELDSNKTYSVEIKEVKTKRSIEQNRLLWALLHEIDVAMNGRPTDEYKIYAMALERANVKYEYIACIGKAYKSLKQNFRAVTYSHSFEYNNKAYDVYKCFIGSSKMDTKEFSLLIDTVLDIASECNIDIDYWSEVLK